MENKNSVSAGKDPATATDECPRPAPDTGLLPCPFCGHAAAWNEEGEQKTKYGNDQAYCPNCYAMTTPAYGKKSAALWWNSRATDPNVDVSAGLVKAIEAEMEILRRT